MARRPLGDPGDEVSTDERADVEAPQQPDPDEPERHGAEHHLLEVEVLEEQNDAHPVVARELPPGEQEGKGSPEQNCRQSSWVPAHQISPLITKDAAIAVPMKVAVAEKLATDPCEQPPRPLPHVHPPAGFGPRPIK